MYDHSFYFLRIIAIEDAYTGPALKDNKVTLEFMLELMEHYKNQKILHRKYAYKVRIIIHNIVFKYLIS